MSLFPRHHDRPLWQLPFKCAPVEKPAKRFEDTKAGNAALWLMAIAAIVICAIRFGLVAMGKQPW